MKTKEICQLVYDKYNVKGGNHCEFSIPFISEYKGKDYVTFFTFEITDNEENFEVKNIVKKILVDYETGNIIEQSIKFNDDNLPIVVNYSEDEWYSEDVENNHYNTIDIYFENIVNHNKTITKMIPKDMKGLYDSLGIKFLN